MHQLPTPRLRLSDSPTFQAVILCRLQDEGIDVLVEPDVHAHEAPDLESWTKTQEPPDFCVTLGGDGTVLHTASLFSETSALPPMLAFALGTLGFLTPFSVQNFRPLIRRCAPRCLACSASHARCGVVLRCMRAVHLCVMYTCVHVIVAACCSCARCFWPKPPTLATRR